MAEQEPKTVQVKTVGTRLVYACPKCGRGGSTGKAGEVRCNCGKSFEVKGAEK